MKPFYKKNLQMKINISGNFFKLKFENITQVENLNVKKQASATSDDSGPIIPDINVVSL